LWPEGEDADLDRLDDSLSSTAGLQLGHSQADVVVDCLDGYAELTGDDLVRIAVGDVTQDLELARAEGMDEG